MKLHNTGIWTAIFLQRWIQTLNIFQNFLFGSQKGLVELSRIGKKLESLRVVKLIFDKCNYSIDKTF
nr:MAG TPA: hypothetical protein [Caudoviricetes sp.]